MRNTPYPGATDPLPPRHPPKIQRSKSYAVYGVEPEIQAYAMAKYSRSALSMKESLKEISQQKAEKFLNTFYFQYGHRSIADLAHIALAIERFRFSRRLPSLTNSAGTARNAPPAIRISRRAATTRRILAGIDPRRASALPRDDRRSCSPNTNRFRRRCSCIWPASRPSPTR